MVTWGGSNPKCEIRNYRCTPWTPKKHMEKWRFESLKILLMEEITSWYGKYIICSKSFIHPRWCRTSSMKSIGEITDKNWGKRGAPHRLSDFGYPPKDSTTSSEDDVFLFWWSFRDVFFFQRRPCRMNVSLKWPSVWSLDRNIGSLEAWLQRQNQEKSWNSHGWNTKVKSAKYR